MKRFNGLTEEQVQQSRAAHGSNLLTPPEKASVWRKYLAKLKDPLIVILMVAGVLSLMIACYEYYFTDAGTSAFFEPIGIFMAVFLRQDLRFILNRKPTKNLKF